MLNTQNLLSVTEQQLLKTLESMAARTRKLPSPEEVQKEMKRLKLKSLRRSRIGQLLASLEQKGRIAREFRILKKLEAVA